VSDTPSDAQVLQAADLSVRLAGRTIVDGDRSSPAEAVSSHLAN